MVAITLCGTLLFSPLLVHVSTLTLDKPTQYYYTGHSQNVGNSCKYNNDELVGEQFTTPIDYEEMEE